MAKVRSSTVTYRAAPASTRKNPADPLRAKIFANGRSQAVRLPKSMRFSCSEVFIRQDGNHVILEPIPEQPVDAKGWPIGFWTEMDRLREGLDWDGFNIEDDPIPEPIRPWDAD
jgi:antitoxin VapB